MRKFGITGKMSSGKSYILENIKNKLISKNKTVSIISVDEIRRNLIKTNRPLQNKLLEAFGTIFPKSLSKIVFTNDANVKLYNQITSPYIKQSVENIIKNSAVDYLFLEWALLVEDDYLPLVDHNLIIVHCEDTTILKRLENSDLSKKEIEKRLFQQKNWNTERNYIKKLCQDNNGKVIYINNETEIKKNSFCKFRIPSNSARVIWEITNKCNYRCPYCIFSSHAKCNDTELSTQRVTEILQELKDYGFTHLKLTGGEPFIRKDILYIMKTAEKLNFKIDISTNASLITPQIAAAIAKLKLDMIHVSLDGNSKEIQEKARGKNTFTPTINGIKNLVSAGVKYIRIGCLIFKDNQEILKEIAQFCKDLGVQEVIFSLMEPVGRGTSLKNNFCTKPLKSLKSSISKINIEGIKISHSFSEKSEKCDLAVCPGGNKFLFINNKGNVSPCTWISEYAPEYIYKKSLDQYTLQEILNNNSFIDITKILSDLGLRHCPAEKIDTLKEVEQIKKALFTPIKKDKRFSQNSPTYIFSTENLHEAFKDLNLDNKRVLSIASSGDQLLNISLKGASIVDCFDINIFSKYIIELKTKAAKFLSYQDFLTLFFNLKNEEKSYKKIRPELSIPCRYLFDNFYHNSQNTNQIFKELYMPKDKILKNNSYLHSKENYQNLQNINYNFIHSDVCNLTEKISQTYDFIFLSNIIDYAHLMYNKDYIIQFYNAVVAPLLPHLSKDGIIYLGYIYDVENKNNSEKRNMINNQETRVKTFTKIPNFSYSEKIFSSAIEENNKDAVLILQRIKDAK